MILLCGCDNRELDKILSVREQLQQKDGCTFLAAITADYGDEIYSFLMNCQTDQQGNLSFAVEKPETIAGITGTISDTGGKLTFDDNALAFELLADGQISPVSAPWILIRTLRSGYIRSCGQTENGIVAIIDDSYEEEALQLEIWLDEDNLPVCGEILWAGRRILSIEIDAFTYL